jgi:hypothetical protein
VTRIIAGGALVAAVFGSLLMVATGTAARAVCLALVVAAVLVVGMALGEANDHPGRPVRDPHAEHHSAERRRTAVIDPDRMNPVDFLYTAQAARERSMARLLDMAAFVVLVSGLALTVLAFLVAL